MKTTPQHPHPRHSTHSAQHGFALVIALTLMSLMILLVISMATLVRVELSTELHTQKQSLARQNALFGLQVAIGQLQQELGPDQRISANAAILDANPDTDGFGDENGAANVQQPYWTGAWNSLDWDNASDRSDDPTLNNASDGKPDSFRGWLVSGFRETNLQGDALLALAKTFDRNSSNAVKLVGEGTVGDSTNMESDYVFALRETIDNSTSDWRESGFAYWVGDEGVKANVHGESQSETIQNIDKLNAISSNSRANLRAIESWETLTEDDLNSNALFSHDILKLAAIQELGDADAYEGKFNAITPYGHGLLVDVQNGGFRQDLSLAFAEADLPESFLTSPDEPKPLFHLGAEAAPTVTGPTWDYVQRFHNRYLMLDAASNGAPRYDIMDVKPEVDNDLAPEKKGDAPMPVVVRYQYIFSLYKGYNTWNGMPYNPDEQYLDANPANGPPNTDHQSNDKIVYLMVTPVIYVWNPYNVTLRMPFDKKAALNVLAAFPEMEFSFDGGASYKDFDEIFWMWAGEIISLDSSNGEEGELIIPPGEMRINTLSQFHGEYDGKLYFSYADRDIFWGDASGGNARRAQPSTGNFSEGIMGLFSPLLKRSLQQPNSMAWPDTKLLAFGSGKIHLRFKPQSNKFIFKFNAGAEGHDRQQAGVFHVNSPTPISSEFLPEEYIHEETINFASLPDLLDLSNNFTGLSPVFSVTLSVRGVDEADGLGKPGLFTDPANAYFYSEIADEDSLAMAPFRITFDGAVASGDYLQYDPNTNRAFFRSGPDLVYSNVAKELPVAPMLSIGQLEHAPLGRDYEHLIYQYTNFFSEDTPPSELAASDPQRRSMGPVYNRAVGNGFLHPMLEPDEVWDGAYNVDRSYFLNSTLFDSYYFSGLADNGGAFALNQKDSSQLLDDFLDGEDSQINPAYELLVPEDQSRESVAEIIEETPGEAYLRLAAFLGVKGAFNINSTSVDAWAAMLSSSRGKAVMYNDLNVGNFAEETDAERTPVISKTFPAGASAESQSGNYQSANAALWSGFRSLSDAQIQGLAKEIVAQVKARGPFLSLGQFFNREISNRDAYNTKGAVQAAIDEAGLNTSADEGALNDALQTRFDSNTVTSEDIAAITRLASPDTLLGDRNEGLPGYITQAELLKPIIPVLSARSETFIIRSYGDVRDVDGTVTEAWCEAVVQRQTNYVGSTDATGPKRWETPTTGSTAERFGREFKIISFRWLSKDEV
ncbi:pilus assembly PilX family protein [Cerasicoccus frondis]|uniref:pilus assembly PilX family protein n=1 Tax=Cerasicoccus frondis TaxID=490090 RepID=UPI002852AA83|nr:hypothetical protein [Cerasicoccus frondis]